MPPFAGILHFCRISTADPRDLELLPRGATTFRAPLAISQLYRAAARVPCRTIDLNRYVNAYVRVRDCVRLAKRLIRDDFYASAASLRLVLRIERVFAARYRYRYRQRVWRPTLLRRVPQYLRAKETASLSSCWIASALSLSRTLHSINECRASRARGESRSEAACYLSRGIFVRPNKYRRIY